MATKTKTTTGRLTKTERLGSSRYGNPRFELTLDDETTYRTQIDGSVGYEVTNFRVGREVVLTLGARSAVIGMSYPAK